MRKPFVAILAALTLASPAAAADRDLEAAATRFLDAWAKGDNSVLATLASRDSEVRMYGSDASEFVRGREGVAGLMSADQKLWRGTAAFEGPLLNVSSVDAGNLATLFFDRVFVVGGRRVPVRFATVWRKEGPAWRLVQSSNVVPTTGQSAVELTR